ncbi:MAG: hypothetical protein A2846_00155 [Candidatus Doudnabacteria bacterium RIFCSPHIGHO2_01_FULL_49_9]|uniref:Uncharacterized protein n=1 Tax=Candidatus Doudnabacteria bacterium RIFCSPHIGHO2_01_FULL_49_9 TaxID=1817827 RepID=A0A1F5P215_9BACT|nr:MAG: hypothetical protein A2846_00155 [Candidatus Doudnabacteria bacterium RIFCSPHIGHO2_01_FULL_49_9]
MAMPISVKIARLTVKAVEIWLSNALAGAANPEAGARRATGSIGVGSLIAISVGAGGVAVGVASDCGGVAGGTDFTTGGGEGVGSGGGGVGFGAGGAWAEIYLEPNKLAVRLVYLPS